MNSRQILKSNLNRHLGSVVHFVAVVLQCIATVYKYMCVYAYIYVYTYVYIHVNICIYIYIYVCIYNHSSRGVNHWLLLFVYINMCTYICR